MKRNVILAAGAVAALVGCSASGNTPSVPGSIANLGANVLQFDVGTANLYGTSTGLNVVVTYRQPASGNEPGGSGALASSPTLHLPFAIRTIHGKKVAWDPTSTAWYGPAAGEMLGRAIRATSQAPGAENVTTFGQSGGAFALGIEPFNALAAGDALAPPINLYGQPFCPQPGLGCPGPYPVPLYNTGGKSKNSNVFEPWGGPPAFNLLGNGHSPVGNTGVPPGYAGLPMGLDIFKLPVHSGTFGLAVSVATQNAGTTTQNASAHLGAAIVLPAATAATFTANGKGGGRLDFRMPSGATEAYIQVTDYGPLHAAAVACNGASMTPPSSSGSSSSSSLLPTIIYYTIVARRSGTYALPDTAGPGGAPSICSGDENRSASKGHVTTGDAFTVQTIAMDYPLYEVSETGTRIKPDPSPHIRGSRGQDNVTISPATCDVAPQKAGAPGSCKLPFPGQP